MAELATIARPYAEALFKASKDNLDETMAWVEELGQICANTQLQDFVSSPNVEEGQVLSLVTGLLKSVLPEKGKNFIQLLLENKRLAVAPEIAAQFRALKNAQLGTSDALVETAFPLDETQCAELLPVLEKRFGRKLELKMQVVPALIGGVRVVVGDEVMDTSVKARLEQMKVALVA